jgi:hypothetical protein
VVGDLRLSAAEALLNERAEAASTAGWTVESAKAWAKNWLWALAHIRRTVQRLDYHVIPS